METDLAPWIDALRHSHDRLHMIAEPLTAGQLQQRSYAREWSIAQVFSHIGSQSEVFGLFLDAGLNGKDAPGREAFPPIWDAWNARSPQAQAADAVAADGVLVGRIESLDAGQRDRFRLELFGMDLDMAGLLRMRLGEHAIHTWDVAVALDPAATVAPDAVALLVDALGQLVTRSGKPDGRQLRLLVSATSPQRHFILEAGETVTLAPAEGAEALPELRLPAAGAQPLPELRLPAEALVRLVYGRLDPAHTPAVEARGVDLDELRRIFPGF
jgi:uncharacterized protein (TIGR03083 family)